MKTSKEEIYGHICSLQDIRRSWNVGEKTCHLLGKQVCAHPHSRINHIRATSYSDDSHPCYVTLG
jgi:hypothetical protein